MEVKLDSSTAIPGAVPVAVFDVDREELAQRLHGKWLTVPEHPESAQLLPLRIGDHRAVLESHELYPAISLTADPAITNAELDAMLAALDIPSGKVIDRPCHPEATTAQDLDAGASLPEKAPKQNAGRKERLLRSLRFDDPEPIQTLEQQLSGYGGAWDKSLLGKVFVSGNQAFEDIGGPTRQADSLEAEGGLPLAELGLPDAYSPSAGPVDVLLVVGDHSRQVGLGRGHAADYPTAVEQAKRQALETVVDVGLEGATVPREVTGRSGKQTVVRLYPGDRGSGIIDAPAGVQWVLWLAGVRDARVEVSKWAEADAQVDATYDALVKLAGGNAKRRAPKDWTRRHKH